jgi:hypothetical protein
MDFTVDFTSTVTGKSISDLEVIIQGELVPSPDGKVDLSEQYTDHGILTVVYQISAPNGTDYDIKYSCTSDEKASSDPKNPSPVDGTVSRNGYKEVTLSIPV